MVRRDNDYRQLVQREFLLYSGVAMTATRQPITGVCKGAVDSLAGVAGSDGDFVLLRKLDGTNEPGVYRINTGGTLEFHGLWRALPYRVAVEAELALAQAAFADARAITEWSPTTTYAKESLCMKNKTFFASAVDGNKGKDPNTDTTGAWAPFIPGEANDIFAGRAPTGLDVQPIGVKWFDTSYGASTPLGYVSRGGGSWVFINAISLRAIRVFTQGFSSSWTHCSAVRFFDASGVQYPFAAWILGNNQGLSSPIAPGAVYGGQHVSPPVNKSAWIEFEPTAQVDLTGGISKIMANFRADAGSTSITRVEFHFTNGSIRVYGGTTGGMKGSDQTPFTASPPVDLQVGSNVESAQGPIKTAAMLTNPDDNEFGRISGASFTSAVNSMISSLVARVEALELKEPI
jgi:hypothetical protein